MPIDVKVNPLNRQANEFIMTVGNHRARVVCKNKKDGKQRASQAILQELHPYINSWGSLLRLYGNRSMRNVKERKHEEQEITMLQSKASLNSPNYAILKKLKSEMMKLHEEMSKRKPIGVFIPPSDVPLPSSGTQLNKVDL
uniref:Microprocessor complex subunit DGCR8 n=2 Tax=Lygus hesperus TaxID=30085 RepID=A0A0K8TAT9_LYGHE